MPYNILKYFYLIRFEKPIGSLLLLWPTLWALWLSSNGEIIKFHNSFINYKGIYILLVFVLGVFLMRSVGCIINDLTDRDFDGKVFRTKNRVLVTEDKNLKVSVKSAVFLLFFLLSLAFILILSLAVYLNNYNLIIHSFIALFLASIYPLCKRFFNCPQFILGLAFAWSIPMAYIAVLGHTTYYTWILFSLSVILTIIYDSFYAMSDIKDDLKLNLKSSVIWFGKHNLKIIVFLQFIFILDLLYLYYLLNFNIYIYYHFIVLLVLLLFCYQFKLAKTRDPNNCLQAFKNSNFVGLIIFLSFL